MIVKPFRGLRPRPDLADKVPSYPYDVIDTAEARRIAEGHGDGSGLDVHLGAARRGEQVEEGEEVRGEDKESANPLESFATDLNEMARQGRIDPLIWRQAEIERTIQEIASEKTWVLPAHDRSLANFKGKVVDKKTGALLNRLPVPRPAGLEWISPDELLVVSAEEKKVLRMDGP